MAEPVSISAKIKISEENYKKYLRKVSQDIASSVFDCIKNEDSNYFVFKYVKKENAFYAFFFFNYGNSDFLLHHSLLHNLKQIEAYLDQESIGYIIANVNAYNCAKADLIFAAKIKNKKISAARFSSKETNEFWNDAAKYFFEETETDFYTAFLFKQIIDKSIVKKVEKLQEEHRTQTLKNSLHTATLEQPIEIFANYFYNGITFYTVELNEITSFVNVNLQELRKTDYGLRDDSSIIIGNLRIMIRDGAKFKKHQRASMRYYASLETVYSSSLEAYPNSDGASFKMYSEYVAEDHLHIYFVGQQFLKTDVGDYKINSCGYYYQNIVLYSAKQIRVGRIVINGIDEASFSIISEIAGMLVSNSRSDLSHFILHCKDKNGELIIRERNLHKPNVVVERISSLSNYLNNLEKKNKENSLTYIPGKFYEYGVEKYYTGMNQWLKKYFEKEYQKNIYSAYLHRGFNDYFYCCFQLYLKSNDTIHFEKAIVLFDKIEKTCFVEPFIFHNIACIYTALNFLDKAIESITAAIYCGYEGIDLIWDDIHLKSLFIHPQFILIKEYYYTYASQYPIIDEPLLDMLNTVITESSPITAASYPSPIRDTLYRVLQNFYIPDYNLLSNEEKHPWRKINPKITLFLNNAFCHHLSQLGYIELYNQYKNYEVINAKTHYYAMVAFFRSAHFKYRMCAHSDYLSIADKIKDLIAKNKTTAEIIELEKEIKASPINKILNIL
ncbi:hypothetical protein CLU81_0600 [Flavobacterium sp. 9]|uniref:hypothetical protein n=1 Tax=Flavobacterium sp. 9 TaxID=2035198 RepID=UPI000C197798|nr:hypothetical protein [Flavobacterium sp. 9]PIF30192.1 hypothetical protein CLU81_0600 [Flavobacterium sp. 9]